MKLEHAEIMPLLANTQIPDIFFSEYLSQKLVLPLKTIQEAIKYWEENGVITKKNNGYIINNLQEIELHKLYKPKTALSADQIQKSAESQQRAKAIEHINNKYFSGLMPTTWYPDIELWFEKYKFDEEVMIALFGYCFDRSALHKSYIQTVAEAWNKNNIHTFNDLDTYYEKQEKVKLIANTISKKLGLHRNLSEYEFGYIETWNNEYGYNLDVIEIALKKTTSKANPNFDYLNKLLSDWHDRGFKTPEEIQNFLSEMKQKNKNIQKLEKQSGYDKYEQRDYSNLNNLYANLKG